MKKMFLLLAVAANSTNDFVTSVFGSGIVTFYFFTLRATFPQNSRLLNVEKLNLDKSMKDYLTDLQ